MARPDTRNRYALCTPQISHTCAVMALFEAIRSPPPRYTAVVLLETDLDTMRIMPPDISRLAIDISHPESSGSFNQTMQRSRATR